VVGDSGRSQAASAAALAKALAVMDFIQRQPTRDVYST
jgi:hypothetical protein